jgi:hypothetical protein
MPQRIWISGRDGYCWLYDDDGHVREIEQFDEKKTRVSLETWPDAASARKAILDGSLTWGPRIDL